MVEHFISLMYPTVCKLSIHLEPTKAENWLKDFETPLNISSWVESVLGFPFVPAKLRLVSSCLLWFVRTKGVNLCSAQDLKVRNLFSI